MKELLNKYPKALLIELILREGMLFRFQNPQALEHKLILLQAQIEQKIALGNMGQACNDMEAARCSGKTDRAKWDEANKRYTAASKLFNHAQGLYKRLESEGVR